MSPVEWVSTASLAIGLLFFIAGTAGLLRFPDVFSRLHALTKCDNLGLGFLLLGIWVRSAEPLLGLKLLLVWIFILISSATACYLVAHAALELGIEPEEKP